MPRRTTSLNNYTGTAISREIASSYNNVTLVADSIDEVNTVATLLTAPGVDLTALGTLTSDIQTLQSEINAVELLAGGKAPTVHTHTSAEIVDSAAKRFVTDAEKVKWNALGTETYLRERDNHTGTQSLDTITETTNKKVMTSAERTKLGAVEAEANKYVHPSKHPVGMLDGSTNYNKFVKTDTLGTVGFGDVTWSEVAGKPSTYTASAHIHSMDEVTTGTISATRVDTTTSRRFVTDDQLAVLNNAETKASKGAANGYVPLDANGKINASYLNGLHLMEVFTPVDQASMLQLNSAQPGDIAYVQDTALTYMLVALPVNVLANWKQLNTVAAVQSVNGLTGIVALSTTNIGEGDNLYHTNERVDDRVKDLLVAGTNVSLVYDDVASTLTVSANDASVNWGELQAVPTTVEGYGITDVYTKTEVNTRVDNVVNNHANKTDNPHNVTKAQTGLGNVDNTSDADKPISTAAQTALDAKVTKNVDIAANTATKITYDAKGLVTAGTNLVAADIPTIAATNVSVVAVGNISATTVQAAIAELDSEKLSTAIANASYIGRADKYLAAQSVTNMLYAEGKLSKVRYNTDTDSDYETMTYNTDGSLSNVAHYVATVLKGNTVLIYLNSKLVSAVYTAV